MGTCFLSGVLAGVLAAPAAAQEMEPKAYSASPIGVTFLAAVASRSTGAIVSDPTLLITDAQAHINGVAMGIGTTFGLFGKLTLASAVVPFAWGDARGSVGQDVRSITRTGLADSRYRISINLRGNDAVTAREFVRAPRRAIVGASLTAAAPTGQYDASKLINLSGHRWAFKPEVGIAVPRGRWDVEAYAGMWLFTSNGDFYPGGRTRRQDSVVAVQAHVSYTFKPRLWLAVDSTWYSGGAARVDDGNPMGSVNNSRLGATLSIPAGVRQSFKVAYSSGLAVRTGSDFRTLSVGWQWSWWR